MSKLIQVFQKYYHSKICILGFGREGKSTLNFLNKIPETEICIADKNIITNEDIPFSKHKIILKTGETYLDDLNDYDLIIKSPGVLLKEEIEKEWGDRLTSQTAIFLEAYHEQIVGITGTKGKSTTTRLIFDFLKSNGKKVVLAGNIGIPPFSIEADIDDKTWIVYELSAHQLKKISYAPHISVLLNIFPEHLDYFGDLWHYAKAKLHIGSFQREEDFFIYKSDNINIQQYTKEEHFSGKLIDVLQNGSKNLKIENRAIYLNDKKQIHSLNIKLIGEHNLLNIVFAMEAANCCGVDYSQSIKCLSNFTPLEHRLEYVGFFNGKHFYNDSIATVPEAAIAAIDAIGLVDTLILGGMDRGIDYSNLLEKLSKGVVKNLFFTGCAGQRMMYELHQKNGSANINCYFSNDWNDLLEKAIVATPENGTCLLSPAAASYGQFRDFEERGTFFKNRVATLQ